MTTTTAVLGAGRMGAALAGALADAGRSVTVWNRTPDKARALEPRGVRAAATIKDAVADAAVVLVNVLDYDVSASVLAEAAADDGLRDRLVVELSSGTPAQARQAAERARAWGAGYLDGAIMATPNFIGSPGGLILYSGERAGFEAHADLLKILGGASLHVGEDPGRASALDMALLTQMWGALFGGLHALAICRAEGVPLNDFETHRLGFNPVVEGAVADLVARTRDRRFAGDTDTLASVAVHHVAFAHVLRAASEQGVDPGIIAPWERLFQAAIGDGRLEDDFAVLARFAGAAA